MAKALETSKLQLVVVREELTDGTVKLGAINFPNIVEAASDESVQEVGNALGNLQKKAVRKVYRIDTSKLD